MTYTQRFSEGWELIDSISPASYNAEQNSGLLLLANYVRTVIIFHAGVLGGNVAIDIEESATATGALTSFDSASKDIDLVATTDDNTISVIEIRNEEFSAGFGYLNVEITPAAAGIFSMQVWGLPVYKPAVTTNLDSVTD
jgi:hypothetical protein